LFVTRLQLIELIDDVKAAMGLTNTWMSGATLPVIDEELIIRVFRWYDDLLELDPRLSAATFVLIEIMQNVREIGSSKVVWHEANKLQPAFHSIKAGSDCAWPHTRNRHILQLGTGAIPGSVELDELAFKSLAEAPYMMYPGHEAADCIPNFLQSFNDLSKVCGLDALLRLESNLS
jgi:hypothetical protein